MMASNEGNPAPPPAPAARLPKLPSNAKIVRPRNADVCLLILRAVLSQGAHRPGGTTYRDVTALLWENSPVILALSLAGSRNGPLRKSREI